MADPRAKLENRETTLAKMEPAGPDHTSGVMRCRFQVLGGHVHCAVFGPFSGKAGDLCFRVGEWDHFRKTHPNWQFQESEHVV